MNLTFKTFPEMLGYEIEALKRISRENEFNQYLFSLENRIKAYPGSVVEFRKELISNYQIYASRMVANGVRMPQNYMEAVYPGMEPPVVLEAMQMQAQQVQQAPVASQMQAQQVTQRSVAPQMQTQQVTQRPVASQMQTQQIQQTPVAPQMQAQQVPQTPVAPQMQTQQVQQAPVAPQMQTQQVQQAPAMSQEPSVKKNKFEFAIGGIVLSVLGVVLILFGFVMLAVNFFDSMWQAVCLYAVCALVFAFSEFLVKRVIKKLSYVLTSFSFAGFFVVTMVNYFALELFNFWIAMIILAVLTILIAFYSYYSKSFIFAMIGYVSSFVTLGLIGEVSSEGQMYMMFGVLLFIQIFWIAFPVQKNGYALSIVQLVGNFVYLMFIDSWGSHITMSTSSYYASTIAMLLSFLVECAILFLASRRYFGTISENRPGDIGKAVPHTILMGIFTIAYFAMICAIESDFTDVQCNIFAAYTFVLVLVPTVLLAYIMKKKDKFFWQQYLYMGTLLSVACTFIVSNNTVSAIVISILVICVTLFAKYVKAKSIDSLDIVLKVFLAFTTIVFSYAFNREPEAAAFILLAACIVEIALGAGFLVVTEIMLTAAVTWSVCEVAPHNVWLMIMSGVLMAATFVYHNVKWLKSKYVLVYDIVAFIEFIVILGLLNHPFYKNDMLPMLVVFVFGMGFLIQYLQKSYKMFFAGNIMPIAIYVSYFVLVLRIDEAVITSAILIIIALVCVALGFLIKQKSVRIFGLVLAMAVCCKLVFYDFWNAASLVKTIMYFVAGILVLAIAGVYIVVEMKVSKNNNKEIEKQNVE